MAASPTKLYSLSVSFLKPLEIEKKKRIASIIACLAWNFNSEPTVEVCILLKTYKRARPSEVKDSLALGFSSSGMPIISEKDLINPPSLRSSYFSTETFSRPHPLIYPDRRLL